RQHSFPPPDRAPEAAANLAADKDNRWLWHYPARRLEAEAIRDSVLFLAGELDFTQGGAEIDASLEPSSRRRSLYFAIYPEVGGQGAFTGLFDPPNPMDCYRRTDSVVPQQ